MTDKPHAWTMNLLVTLDLVTGSRLDNFVTKSSFDCRLPVLSNQFLINVIMHAAVGSRLLLKHTHTRQQALTDIQTAARIYGYSLILLIDFQK